MDAIIDGLNKGMRSVCVSMPTASGKTATLSALVQRFISKGHNACVITHVRELITQIERTAKEFVPEDQIGVIAAGLRRKDEPRKLQICQIQTVGRRPSMIGPRRIVIVDELQLINQEQGLYIKTIEALKVMDPDLRLVGLSATPWRTQSGLAYGDGRIFQDCVYRIGMRELVADGYLTPIVGKTGDKEFKVEGVAMRGGDYKPDELEHFMLDRAKVDRAVDDMIPRCAERNQVLVFAVSRKHSEMIAESIRRYDQGVMTLDGTTETGMRDRITSAFRERGFKYLCNVGVLTTGFDDPGIDAICMLRPTRSPGLLLQIAGRGLRLDPRKKDCLFLDYGGCLSYFGPLDTIEENITDKRRGRKGAAPTKVCPDCDTVLHAAALVCTTCGKVFHRLLKHEEKATDAPAMSDTPITWNCHGIVARPHRKPGKPMTLRIDYQDDIGIPMASEWLSIHHDSTLYAYRKSIKQLAAWPGSPFLVVGDLVYRKDKMTTSPLTPEEIVDLAKQLPAPTKITTIRDGKYVRVTHKEFT